MEDEETPCARRRFAYGQLHNIHTCRLRRAQTWTATLKNQLRYIEYTPNHRYGQGCVSPQSP